MLRSFLIYLSQADWAQRMVTRWGFAWRTASRFVAGQTMQDALRVVAELNQRGANATLDHLGEHTSTTQEAGQATEDILKIIEELGCCEARSNV
jgi:proline dehydrogenase